jgi:hypothetical protein
MSVNIADRDLIEDPNEYEEPEQFTTRQYLGLRPVAFPADDQKHTHPDQRPCPPWCDIGNSEWGHEIDPRAVFSAEHNSERVTFPATMYGGSYDQGPSRRLVIPATIECSLSQNGQTLPKISVALRHNLDGEARYQERLRLSVNDARDLIATLTYLVGLTEYDR